MLASNHLAEIPYSGKRKSIVRLSSEEPADLVRAAQMIAKGKIGAIGFNGIYGLFGDIDNLQVSDDIMVIKNRQGKKLIGTVAPEHLDEHVDFNLNRNYSHEQVIALQKGLHAIGVILPASDKAPDHIITYKNGMKSILSIWTEYQPLRKIIEEIRNLGLRALVGTSANKSGRPTHFDTTELHNEFKEDLDFILEADYSAYPKNLRQSTSIIDLTERAPRLHRLGSVSEEEIRKKLRELKFPDPIVDEEKIIKVVARK